MEHTSKVEPPSDWFISLIERKTFQTTYLTLSQLLEHSSGTSKAFINTGVTLGRKSSDADYVTREGRFDSPIISRSHAQLNITQNGHVYLTDLASMHGTSITLDAPNNYETTILAKHSPVQLLHGDNVFLGKRISSNGKDFDPVKLLIKFRYPEFGKGSTFDGRRKKIGEIKRESANGKFADSKQEQSIRRLILNLSHKQDEKAIRREEIKILEQRIEIIAEKINSKSRMKQISSPSNNDQIQMDPEIEEEDSVEFTHEILSQDNISKLTPIDLRSDRSSPFSVRVIDEDQENTMPTSPPITRCNTYKAPASILSMSEEDLPRYASDVSDEELDDEDSMVHRQFDEDSMTDYDDEDDDQEPEVMGVHEDGSQTKLYADEDDEEVQSEDAMSYTSIDEGEDDEEDDEDDVEEEDDDDEEEEDESHQVEFDEHSDSELSVTYYQYGEDEFPQDEEEEVLPHWDYDNDFPPLGKIPVLQTEEPVPSTSFSAVAIANAKDQAEAEQQQETAIQGFLKSVLSLPLVTSDEPEPPSHHHDESVGMTKEAKRELIDDHAIESEIWNSALARNLEEGVEEKQEMQISSQDVAVSMDEDHSQPAGEVESAALIPDVPKSIMDNHIAAMRASTRPQTSFERPRTPSISDASSEGPITPGSNKKRPLPEEFTIINDNDHSDGLSDMVDVPSNTNDNFIERPKKRLRKIKSAIGLIALGAALGSATTVTLLLQVAPQSL